MDQHLQSTTHSQAQHSRSFSRASDKSSDRVSTSNDKADKARRDSLLRGESKANPNAALNEAQPTVIAALETTTLDNLRSLQHKDNAGNIITEPDLSNPTRPRWERPLDTIRSFEKAIDGGYKRRSVSRGESYDASNQYASRRSSYFGGNGNGPNPSRQSQVSSGYYGGGRPDSYYDNNGYGSNQPARQRYSNRGNGGYAQHNYQQSHDTVNTGMTNGSDSTGPWGTSTHPSSENSSPDHFNDRGKGARTPQGMDGYGHDGHGGPPIPEEYASDDSNGYAYSRQRRANGNGGGYPHNDAGPPPPAHSAPRQTIQLGGGGGGDSSAAFASQPGHLPSNPRPQEEKRKSWLKRRFSKNE